MSAPSNHLTSGHRMYLRILVADEDASVRQTLSDILEKELGHCVEWAETSQAVVFALARTKYDVIFLSREMSNGEGEAILDWIRAHRIDEPIVVVSSCCTYETFLRLASHGATDLLSRPIEREEVCRALQWAAGPAATRRASSVASPANARSMRQPAGIF